VPSCSCSSCSSSSVASSNGRLAVEHPLGLLAVELLGPVSDEDGRDRVAREVGQRAGLGHEPVDAEDEADAVDQLGPVRLQAAGQVAMPEPLTPAAPFDAMIMNTSRPICSASESGSSCAAAMNSVAMVR